MCLNMQDLICCSQMDISMLIFKTDFTLFKTMRYIFLPVLEIGVPVTGMYKRRMSASEVRLRYRYLKLYKIKISWL